MPHERAATELRGRAARPSGRPVSPCLLEPSPSPWSPPLPTATSSTSTSRSPSLRPPSFTPPAQRTWRRPAGRTAPSGATSPSPATESASLFQPATLSSRPCPAAPAATSAGAAANAAARGHSSNATARASRGCSPTASTSTSRGRPSRSSTREAASEPSSALAARVLQPRQLPSQHFADADPQALNASIHPEVLRARAGTLDLSAHGRARTYRDTSRATPPRGQLIPEGGRAVWQSSARNRGSRGWPR